MTYRVAEKNTLITENVTIMPEDFSGWQAINVGVASGGNDAAATINGLTIYPGDKVDYLHIDPNVIWSTPIVITITTGAVIRLTRLLYSQNQ